MKKEVKPYILSLEKRARTKSLEAVSDFTTLEEPLPRAVFSTANTSTMERQTKITEVARETTEDE